MSANNKILFIVLLIKGIINVTNLKFLHLTNESWLDFETSDKYNSYAVCKIECLSIITA